MHIKQSIAPTLLALSVSIALSGCLESEQQDPKVSINKNPYPSTYKPLPKQTTLIKNTTTQVQKLCLIRKKVQFVAV